MSVNRLEVLSVLYVASFEYGDGSTSWQRMEALRSMGHNVTALDTNTPLTRRFSQFFIVRALVKTYKIELCLIK